MDSPGWMTSTLNPHHLPALLKPPPLRAAGDGGRRRRRSRLRALVKYEPPMLFLPPPNGLFTCQRRQSRGKRMTLFSEHSELTEMTEDGQKWKQKHFIRSHETRRP